MNKLKYFCWCHIEILKAKDLNRQITNGHKARERIPEDAREHSRQINKVCRHLWQEGRLLASRTTLL